MKAVASKLQNNEEATSKARRSFPVALGTTAAPSFWASTSAATSRQQQGGTAGMHEGDVGRFDALDAWLK